MTCLACGVLLYRLEADGPRLLLLRNASNGQWGFPKGRREQHDIHEVGTALREVHEETGYVGIVLHPEFRRTLEYRVRGADGGYDKRVTYFLARAPAQPPQLSGEHSETLWATPAQAAACLNFGQQRDLALAAFAAAVAAG